VDSPYVSNVFHVGSSAQYMPDIQLRCRFGRFSLRLQYEELPQTKQYQQANIR